MPTAPPLLFFAFFMFCSTGMRHESFDLELLVEVIASIAMKKLCFFLRFLCCLWEKEKRRSKQEAFGPASEHE
uniref:Secreted protein n=1 Tax=Setaria viridis TaxID=4556 RepID=A0A4U6WAF0_SETVI|nr:hypothetical protein SEVIR_1G185650v2 [Setaria viridis]